MKFKEFLEEGKRYTVEDILKQGVLITLDNEDEAVSAIARSGKGFTGFTDVGEEVYFEFKNVMQIT